MWRLLCRLRFTPHRYNLSPSLGTQRLFDTPWTPWHAMAICPLEDGWKRDSCREAFPAGGFAGVPIMQTNKKCCTSFSDVQHDDAD